MKTDEALVRSIREHARNHDAEGRFRPRGSRQAKAKARSMHRITEALKPMMEAYAEEIMRPRQSWLMDYLKRG